MPARAYASQTLIHWLTAIFLGGMLSLSLTDNAQSAEDEFGFNVRAAHTRLVDDVYLLYAQIHYHLSPPVREALDNGLPLTLEIQVEVLRDYFGVYDYAVATLSQRFRIQYHALSRQYLVKNLNSSSQYNHSSLSSALAALGSISELPILDRRLLKAGTYYSARVRSRLDIEALPTPLRLSAYLNSDWRQTSEWYSWPLQQ